MADEKGDQGGNVDTARSSPPLYKVVNRPVQGTGRAAEAGFPRAFLLTALGRAS
jgi:hypothetical protein